MKHHHPNPRLRRLNHIWPENVQIIEIIYLVFNIQIVMSCIANNIGHKRILCWNLGHTLLDLCRKTSWKPILGIKDTVEVVFRFWQLLKVAMYIHLLLYFGFNMWRDLTGHGIRLHKQFIIIFFSKYLREYYL